MWGDDVEHFVPDRWLDKSRIPEHPAAFAAFSIGRRMNFKVKSDISKLQLKLDIMLRPASGHYISVESR
ncbi:hypothetical protein MSG28_014231, partial [Choristoneura fumiferana]